MQRYKNIYIEGRPKELVPTFQIQYSFEITKHIAKNKINERTKRSKLKEKK